MNLGMNSKNIRHILVGINCLKATMALGTQRWEQEHDRMEARRVRGYSGNGGHSGMGSGIKLNHYVHLLEQRRIFLLVYYITYPIISVGVA